MSMFSDMESQLQGRSEAKDVGISIPKGNDETYVKWLKHMESPGGHARAMILLQRTWELDKQDWLKIRDMECRKFGEESYMEPLRKRGSVITRAPIPEEKSFDRKNTLMAAIKAEERGRDRRWEDQISHIIESPKSNDPQEMMMLMKELRPSWRRGGKSIIFSAIGVRSSAMSMGSLRDFFGMKRIRGNYRQNQGKTW
jgi:hypothetical protein